MILCHKHNSAWHSFLNGFLNICELLHAFVDFETILESRLLTNPQIGRLHPLTRQLKPISKSQHILATTNHVLLYNGDGKRFAPLKGALYYSMGALFELS